MNIDKGIHWYQIASMRSAIRISDSDQTDRQAMTHRQPHLRILGLGPTATAREIKERYRYLVSKWHPDRFVNDSRLLPLAEETLKQINISYAALRSDSTTATNLKPRRQHPGPIIPTARYSGESWSRRLMKLVLTALKRSHQKSSATRMPRTAVRSSKTIKQHQKPFRDILMEMGVPQNRLRQSKRTKHAGRRMDRRRRAIYRRSGSGMRVSTVASDTKRPQRVGKIRSIRPIGSDDG